MWLRFILSSVWVIVLLIILMLGMRITTDMGLIGFAIAIAAFLAHMAAGIYVGVVDLTPRPRGLVAAQRSDFAAEQSDENRQVVDPPVTNSRRELVD
ncbi:hypothetical protein [Povalibacter sp.]|uniref:hypothetical protein n=1 Tax=Povalibacter sp. TaxID=1962978 RepID=UPI002F4213A7